MSWKNRQKGVVKIYQRYAEIPDIEYRALLHEYTGAMSSTHRALSQWHFDVFMPALEFRVQQHYERTAAPLPKQIRDLWYWRNRNPMNGTMNTRHKHKIWKLWGLLVPVLPEPIRDPVAYMCHMAAHASGKSVPDFASMPAATAMLLIEALKSHLAQQLRRAA